MNKKAKIATIITLMIVVIIAAVFIYAARGPKACNNNIDDDNDGLIDFPNDPGCSNRNDASETSSSLVCDNGADEANDADTLADYRLSNGDPGCTSAIDSSEIDGQCDDLADNDGDTYIDYPDDAGCTGPSDNDETNCGDSVCEGGELCDICIADCGHCDSCSDTDGWNVYNQGTVSGYMNNIPYSYTDYCIDSDVLTEYVCYGTNPNSYNETCSHIPSNTTTYICQNGACVPT